jgi:hypothetical protein
MSRRGGTGFPLPAVAGNFRDGGFDFPAYLSESCV